ncbi:hypothetical protein F383_20400 [Gossypium arboreum]|uniref:Uncharacterized protein n=1 Tax=Gossypium arboreum TaxID=29729 RepID=A0A0B0NTZ1_GOSAR|nr:hypothetical protein F383_20400 [Gossypium arboreum]
MADVMNVKVHICDKAEWPM